MAVTILAEALAKAVRVDINDADLLEELRRLLAVATLLVQRYAPDAPSDIQNQAVVQVVGYVLDAPVTDGVRNVVPASMRLSGANALLLPWRVHRGGAIGTGAAIADVVTDVGGSTANPVIGLGIAGHVLSVRFADQSVARLQLPVEEGGGGATGQELVALAGRVAALEAQDGASAADLAVLAARVAMLEGVAHVTPAELAVLRASVDAIDQRVTADTGNIAGLANRIASIEGGHYDVIDIGTTPLPEAAADEKGRIYLDPLHQRGYFIGQSRLAATDGFFSGSAPAGGSQYLGEFSSDVSARAHVEERAEDAGKYYWNTHDHLFHEWARITVGSAQNYFFRYVRNDGVAGFLAGKENYAHSGPSGSPTDRNVYWLGYGTVAEITHRLPANASDKFFRAYAVATDGNRLGLLRFNRSDYNPPQDTHEVFSWLPIAVAGISAVPPAIVGDLETRVAALEGEEAGDFATDMELSALAARVAVLEAAPAPAAEIDWQVISRYHNVGTHPNDLQGYVADDSIPPLTYHTSGSTARPSDAVGLAWPAERARFVAVQNEGEAAVHRLIVPSDKELIHVQVQTARAAGLFFIADIPTLTGGYNAFIAGGNGLQIPFNVNLIARNEPYAFCLAMTSTRELLVGWMISGENASVYGSNFAYAANIRSLIVRVA